MAVIFSFGSLFTLIYGGDALRGASRVIAFREASLSMDGVATAPAGDGKPLTSTHWEDSKIKARDGYDFLGCTDQWHSLHMCYLDSGCYLHLLPAARAYMACIALGHFMLL